MAAGIILTTGFDRADPIVSLLIAGLLLHAAYGLLKESRRVFMEAAQVDHEAAPQGPLQIEVTPGAERGTESYTRPQ